MTQKATQRNGVAEASDQHQLELSMEPAKGDARASDPRAARARSIVSSLSSLSSEEVFAAFEELDALPAEVVRAALAPSTGPAPDLERLDDAMRRAHGLPPRALRLATVSVVHDADIFDAGDVAEAQLRIAGKAWDGRDLAPEERLDDEVEGSFAGTLERRVLGDADAPSASPLFDVLLYSGDAGAIFRAGTTELIGAVDGTTVELSDHRARSAIREALAAPVEAGPPETARSEPTPTEAAASVEREVDEPARAPRKKAVATKKKASAAKATAKTAATKAKATTKAKAPTKAKAAASKKVAAEKPSRAKAAPEKKRTTKTSAKRPSAKAGARKAASKKPAKA